MIHSQNILSQTERDAQILALLWLSLHYYKCSWLGWPWSLLPTNIFYIFKDYRWTLAKSVWSEEHWVGNGEWNNNCIRITKPCSAVWTCFYPFYIVCNWIRIIFLPLKCFTRQGDVFSNANAIPVALCTTPINLETTKHFSVSLFTSSGCNYWITY